MQKNNKLALHTVDIVKFITRVACCKLQYYGKQVKGNLQRPKRRACVTLAQKGK